MSLQLQMPMQTAGVRGQARVQVCQTTSTSYPTTKEKSGPAAVSHSLTCLRVTGLTVSIAGTKHTGTVGSETRGFSPVTREAHLTELPSITHWTGAGLHPSCRDSRPRTSTCQGDIIQISSTCVYGVEERITEVLSFLQSL